MEFRSDIIEKLPKLEIFSDFTEKTEDSTRILKKICSSLEVKDFAKGEVIINEGDLGDTLYILHTGRVQVKRNTFKVNYELPISEDYAAFIGDFFGIPPKIVVGSTTSVWSYL